MRQSNEQVLFVAEQIVKTFEHGVFVCQNCLRRVHVLNLMNYDGALLFISQY